MKLNENIHIAEVGAEQRYISIYILYVFHVCMQPQVKRVKRKREEAVQGWSGGKAKEDVFLRHGSQWNAGRMPSIACWNSFFLFSLKGLALFSLEIF